MNSDIESLMSQYLDGRMSPAEAAELSRHLIENPEAAARFAELTRTDEGLRVALKAESRSQIFAARLRTQPENQPAKTTAPDRRRWLAAAAGLAVLGGTAWWFTSDRTVPAVVMDWAKSRVKRHSGGEGNGGDSGPLASADFRASLPADRAAELRRKLRNFAIPYLHMRSMPVSDALNTLSLQWTSLPHVKAEDAEKVKIALADSVRKRWPTTDKEPVVSLDIPNLSLHTALNLVAAQAGLKVDVTDEAVTLLPDPALSPAKAGTVASSTDDKNAGTTATAKPEDLKTWTFPLTKPVAETFLTSLNQRQQPPATDPANLTDFLIIAGRVGNTAAAAPADHYNFSYGWAKQPPAAVAGVAGGGEAAGAVVTPNIELSFSQLDTQADAGTNQAAIQFLSDGLTRTEAASTVTAGEPVATLDGTDTQVAVENLVRVEATLQQAITLPSLATTDTYAENGTAPAGVVTYDFVTDGTLTVSNDRAAINKAPEVVYFSHTAHQPSETTDQPATFIGVADSSLKLGRLVTGAQPPATARFVQSVDQVTGVTWTALPAAATLDSWLTGLSGGGTLSHDTENSVLSVTGTAAELRTASAAVAALNESVRWGVSIDARCIELGDLPAPETGAGTISAAEVDKLCKAAASTPGSACLRLPASAGPLEKAAHFWIENGDIKTAVDGISSSILNIEVESGASSPGISLDASVTATKQGERWTLTTAVKDGSSGLNNTTSLMDGSWLVLETGTKGRLLLLRPRSANVGS